MQIKLKSNRKQRDREFKYEIQAQRVRRRYSSQCSITKRNADISTTKNTFYNLLSDNFQVFKVVNVFGSKSDILFDCIYYNKRPQCPILPRF